MDEKKKDQKDQKEPRLEPLSTAEQQMIAVAQGAVFQAKASIYDLQQQIEAAEKKLFEAQTAMQAAFAALVTAHGMKGNVRLVDGKALREE